MKILVLNSGSSSLKFQLFDMHTQEVIALGIVEQIGEQQSKAKQACNMQQKKLLWTLCRYRQLIFHFTENILIH